MSLKMLCGVWLAYMQPWDGGGGTAAVPEGDWLPWIVANFCFFSNLFSSFLSAVASRNLVIAPLSEIQTAIRIVEAFLAMRNTLRSIDEFFVSPEIHSGFSSSNSGFGFRTDRFSALSTSESPLAIFALPLQEQLFHLEGIGRYASLFSFTPSAPIPSFQTASTLNESSAHISTLQPQLRVGLGGANVANGAVEMDTIEDLTALCMAISRDAKSFDELAKCKLGVANANIQLKQKAFAQLGKSLQRFFQIPLDTLEARIFRILQEIVPPLLRQPAAKVEIWKPETMAATGGIEKLSALGKAQIIRGQRKCSKLDVPYLGDPALRSIRTTEVSFLVPWLLLISNFLNRIFGFDEISSTRVFSEPNAPRRINLRPMANKLVVFVVFPLLVVFVFVLVQIFVLLFR